MPSKRKSGAALSPPAESKLRFARTRELSAMVMRGRSGTRPSTSHGAAVTVPAVLPPGPAFEPHQFRTAASDPLYAETAVPGFRTSRVNPMVPVLPLANTALPSRAEQPVKTEVVIVKVAMLSKATAPPVPPGAEQPVNVEAAISVVRSLPSARIAPPATVAEQLEN